MLEPLSETEARALALELGSHRYELPEGDALVFDESATARGAVGWVFRLDSRVRVETDSFEARLLGPQYVFVDEHDREARFIDRRVPTNFDVLGRPSPDWPAAAFVTMPLAAVLEAAVWWGCWMIHDAIGGLVVLGLLTILVAGLIATAPVRWLVRATGFRNLRKAIPVLTTAFGIVLGEFALAVYLVVSEAPGMGVTDALPFVGDWFAAQSTDYLALHVLAAVVMLGVSSTFDDDGSSVSYWNGTIADPRLRAG